MDKTINLSCDTAVTIPPTRRRNIVAEPLSIIIDEEIKPYRKPVIRNFPYCCTGVVIARFGESVAAEGGEFDQNEVLLCGFIYNKLDELRDLGYAFASCTTNDEQHTTNMMLTDIGFKHSKWMIKGMHPETRVRLWWLPLN